MMLDEYAGLFDSGSLAVLKLTKTGDGSYRISEFSGSLCGLTEFSSGELENEDFRFSDIIFDNDLRRLSEKLVSQRSFSDYDFRIVTKNANVSWVRGNFNYIEEKDAYTASFFRFFKGGEPLPECAGSDSGGFGEMFSRHSAIMYMYDPFNRKVADANEAAAKFYGYSRKEMRGLSVDAIERLPKSVIKSEIENELHWNKRYFISKHANKKGEIKDVEVFSTPMRCGGSIVFFSIVRDITHKKHVEKKLEERTRQLQELNVSLGQKINDEFEKRMRQEQLLIQQSKLAAMGEMVGAIAHQWRQPLNALGLIVQDIEDAMNFGEADGEYISRNVEKGMKQIKFMSKTIDDFRNFFKPSREKEPFNVLGAVSDLVSLMSAQLRNNVIKLKVTITCDGEVHEFTSEEDDFQCHGKSALVTGYMNEFKQVLMNLIDNAKDSVVTQRLGVGLQGDEAGQIIVNISADDDNVFINIKDNGGGVPEDLKNRIFEPYFTTKKDSQGTGIGLYMSKTIIESNMDGELYLEDYDGGASFTIKLKRYFEV